MASESEEYEYYAYSSDEEIVDDGSQGDDDGDVKMHWQGASDNPNAAPMHYRSGKFWPLRRIPTGFYVFDTTDALVTCSHPLLFVFL